MSEWLDRAKEDFAKLQEIRERNGFTPPPPEEIAFETVKMEMTDVGGLDIGRETGGAVYLYVKTKNFYFIDQAISICAKAKVSPSPTLLDYVIDAASRRLSGKVLPGNTLAKITLPQEKYRLFMLMANLIFHGATLREAASKAARYHNDRVKNSKTRKASTLEKDYADTFRKIGSEKRLFESWKRIKDPNIAVQWKKLREALPEAKPYELGNRHR